MKKIILYPIIAIICFFVAAIIIHPIDVLLGDSGIVLFFFIIFIVGLFLKRLFFGELSNGKQKKRTSDDEDY